MKGGHGPGHGQDEGRPHPQYYGASRAVVRNPMRAGGQCTLRVLGVEPELLGVWYLVKRRNTAFRIDAFKI